MYSLLIWDSQVFTDRIGDLPFYWFMSGTIFFTVKSVNFHWITIRKTFFTAESVDFRWSNQWNSTDSQ